MPSIITHAAVGVAAAGIFTQHKAKLRFWILSILCPILRDADSLAFRIGIPYEHLFGHRGFFHPPLFSLILALIVVLIFFRHERVVSKRWLFLGEYFFLLKASHGLLDALTSGGLGVTFLVPFVDDRYFSPATPIQVSPLSIKAFFSSWGVKVLKSEFVWVWIPLVAVVITVRIFNFILPQKGR